MSYPQNDRKIYYVEFPTTDLVATQAFFTGVFGWEWESYGPNYAAGVNAGLDCGLAKVNEPPPDGAALVILWADDLEATRDRVMEHAGVITEPIFGFPGGRRFHFREPGGNQLAVCTGE